MPNPETTDIKGLMAQVKDRNRRWSNCPRHFFPHSADGYKIGQKVRCAICGSDASLVDIGNYIRGFVAAGGDALDVMPDWRAHESVNGSVGVVNNVQS